MKKLLSLLTIFLIVLSCSSDETSTPVTPPPAPIAKYTISFSAGDGGTVSTTGGEYEEGQTVSVTATPQGEYLFTGWSDGNTDATRTITVDATKTLTANFERRKYALTLNFVGEGEVSEEIVNAGRTTEYDSGSTVKLTAEPAGEWVFVGWTGDVESTENPIQVAIGEPKEITATFEKKKYSLTITIEGEGEVLEEIVNAGRTTDYDSGTTVKLTAVPSDGWEFAGWSDGDTDTARTITVDANKTLTANFERNITSIDAETYLTDGTNKKTNIRPEFESLDLEVLYSDNFAIWWDKSTGIDHYPDAVDILKWSEISFEKSFSYSGNYRPEISQEYYINIYIHHPTYNGEPDNFPNDWGQFVGGENYGGTQGPYVAYPYGQNQIDINKYEPRMNVPHETFHVVQFDRPRRTKSDGSWWTEATASLFELVLISENPDPNSFFRGKSMHGAPSLVMLPHFSPWYAPNRPNGPGEWDLWSSGIHKYQTSYFLRYISQNSNFSVDDILSQQFIEKGDLSSNGYFYYEPIDVLVEMLGREVFENIFFEYVKAVSDLSFLSDYEKTGYLRALEDVLRYPIEDKRISLEINENGQFSPNYKNQALSWTVLKVNGIDFNYEIIPSEFGSEGTASEFKSFRKVDGNETLIYVVNLSDKSSGNETFDYQIIIEDL